VRRVVRRRRIARPVDAVFAACVDLLRTPDEARGVVARHIEPEPPAVDAVVHTTVRDARGERSLRATLVVFEPGVELATVTDGAPAVRTALHCAADGDGGTVVTLTGEAEGTLSQFGRGGAALDWVLFSRGQRRAALATLRRIEELSRRA
jgi:Polyketide cyclase / dehydrase and lipid transport